MLSEADFFLFGFKAFDKMDWAVLVQNVWVFPSFGPVVHKMKGGKTYSKNCLKKVCFLSFIANHNPMCHGLEIDMCFFFCYNLGLPCVVLGLQIQFHNSIKKSNYAQYLDNIILSLDHNSKIS
jgi:hypothetical protein